jgi:CRISPR/Cas system-associated protein Cas7 (RAMP superfamily)
MLNSKNYNTYVYQFIREHGGWDHWDMVLVEKYNASDKLDARARERYWIEQLHAELNKKSTRV